MLNLDLQSHKPLRDIVYEEVKHQILTGQITPGTRMMEVELADSMGVSRTPVREAMRKLENDGLVIIEPRHGAYVSDISVKDMLDTLVVREDLEGLAAYLATQNTSDEQIEKLEMITKGYSDAIASGDTEGMIRYDEAFHKQVVEMSENKTLIQLFETIHELALRFRYLYYDDFTRYENMPVEHRKIIDAIKGGDGATARKVSDNHVKKLKEFVMTEGNRTHKD